MSRLALLNPHLADFTGIPLSYFLLRKRALKKYDYLNKLVKSFNESNNINDKLVSNIKNKSSPEEMIKDLEIRMKDAAANLEFEEAAKLRDTIRKLEHKHLGLKLK